jgi:hypothetical protein
MITHELKTDNPYFTDIWNGLKDFDIRLNDRNYRVSDFITLNEVGEKQRKIYGEIKYILFDYDFPDGIKKGHCILGLKITNRAGHR